MGQRPRLWQPHWRRCLPELRVVMWQTVAQGRLARCSSEADIG